MMSAMRDLERVSFLESEGRSGAQEPSQRGRASQKRLAWVIGAVAFVVTLAVVARHSSTQTQTRLGTEGGDAESIEAFKAGPLFAPKAPGVLRHFNPFKAIQEAKEKARKKALIDRATTFYSEPTAEAFAVMAKLAYCGNLPGIYSAAAMSCSALHMPGASTSCERAHFRVVPGMVRTFGAADQGVWQAVTGFMMMVEPLSINATVDRGVLVVFRGSVNNYVNSVRDKQTLLEKGLEGCEECGVHDGYHKTYHLVEQQIKYELLGLGCVPGECKVYVTGHASGAAMASVLAWELAHRNYTIGTSYLFESPQVGDKVFAEKMSKKFMGQGKNGPIFSVVTGKDAAVRWPFNETFKSWGLEVDYDVGSTKYNEMCLAGDKTCGIAKVPRDELVSKDLCSSALAPWHTFCKFEAYAPQCYGGLGYQVVKNLPKLLKGLPQPPWQAAATWHPSSEDGEQKDAISEVLESAKNPAGTLTAKQFYSEKTLRAWAALAKITYCGPSPGVVNAVMSTCNDVCRKAGFNVVPGSVQSVGVSYQSELAKPYVRDTLYALVMQIRRLEAKYAEAPYFMPAEACAVVFRGTANSANMDMNVDVKQVPLNDTECDEATGKLANATQCTMNHGLLMAWKNGWQANILEALKKAGCEADPKKETTNKVFFAGHSMGGTMSTVAMYWMQKLGFDVQLSWSLEGGRPGNEKLVKYISTKMIKTRPVPAWVVSYKNDAIPRTLKSYVNGGRLGRFSHMVSFNSGKMDEPQFCVTEESVAEGSRCGPYKWPRDELAKGLPNEEHCNLPYAPKGRMCMIPMSLPPYAVELQCTFGGSFM